MKIIRYFFEFILVIIFFTIFKIIGPKKSSDLGGYIGKYFGPLFKKKEIINKNILFVFPKISEKEKNELIVKMWENIGRIFGEYIHLDKFSIYNQNKIKINFKCNLDIEETKNYKKPVVFFSGHFANFELMGVCLKELNFNIGVIYRPLNNFFINPIWEIIKRNSSSKLIEKGSKGSKKLINHIKQNNSLGLLVDQRLSSSIHVPFFGKLATTTITPAKLAIKYDALLIPMFIQRINKTNFNFFLEEPLKIKKSSNIDEDIFNITQIMNKKIEEFIIRDPGSWLWSHDRWR
jgi:KDO2-lipid IV(A) lauroyltransferase